MTKNQLIEKLVENYDKDTQSSYYKSFKLKITQDEDAPNPRQKDEKDNSLYCINCKHNLGDDDCYSRNGFKDWNRLKECLEKDFCIDTILPVFMFENLDSGKVILNTTGFSGVWDSGKVGFIFMNKYHRKQLPPFFDTREYLEKRVDEYSRYLRGEIYKINLYYRDNFISGEGEITQDVDIEVIKNILTNGCVFDNWDNEKFGKLINLDNRVQSLLAN